MESDTGKRMIEKEAREELVKQQYRIVGSHSAVKICTWTKKMIRGEGACYKHVFYGIMSNQCMQMTTSISCGNRCVFCWRGYKAPVSKEWIWDIDEPEMIMKKAMHSHYLLLSGFGGNKKSEKDLLKQAKQVKHVALSLTGEPITYPKINELLALFHQNKITTFVVTNAQNPEHIRNLKPITQLYLSIDAPTKDLLKQIDNPLFVDYWERMLQSLEELHKKKQRTCIRLTMIKGLNMTMPEKYAELINMAKPDFIEAKAYMHLGESRQKLVNENMPRHLEVLEFAVELAKFLPDYEVVSEHKPSRVVMLAKKKFRKNVDGKEKWFTWIDFDRFFELCESGIDFSAEDYLKETPEEFVMQEQPEGI